MHFHGVANILVHSASRATSSLPFAKRIEPGFNSRHDAPVNLKPSLVHLVCSLLFLSFVVRADLLVSSYSSGRIFRFNEHTGQFIDIFVNTNNGGLSWPHGLAFGPDGHLYVASASNDCVLRFDGTNGTFLNAFVTNSAGGLDYPVWLEFRGDSLYVSSQLNNRVLRYATNATSFSTFVASGSDKRAEGDRKSTRLNSS